MAKSNSDLSRKPLHQQIADILEAEIHQQYVAGDRLPSESELAKRFSVSTLTLREALAILAEAGLVERQHGRGTYVTNSKRIRHIGILIEMDISSPNCSPYWLHAIQGLRQYFEGHNWRTRLYVGRWPMNGDVPDEHVCPEFQEDVNADRLQGVVCLAGAHNAEWVKTLRQRGIPVVGDEKVFAHRVSTNSDSILHDGLERLVNKGCRRIAVIGWGTNRERIRTRMKALGVPYLEALVSTETHPTRTGACYAAMQSIWSEAEDKPDGLLICDDTMFFEVSYFIMEAGIQVPRDLKVVSHANRGASTFYPFATDLMEFDPAEVAEKQGEILLRLIAGEKIEPCLITIPYRWVKGKVKQTSLGGRPRPGEGAPVERSAPTAAGPDA